VDCRVLVRSKSSESIFIDSITIMKKFLLSLSEVRSDFLLPEPLTRTVVTLLKSCAGHDQKQLTSKGNRPVEPGVGGKGIGRCRFRHGHAPQERLPVTGLHPGP
jgi:hypothetical protein